MGAALIERICRARAAPERAEVLRGETGLIQLAQEPEQHQGDECAGTEGKQAGTPERPAAGRFLHEKDSFSDKVSAEKAVLAPV